MVAIQYLTEYYIVVRFKDKHIFTQACNKMHEKEFGISKRITTTNVLSLVFDTL